MKRRHIDIRSISPSAAAGQSVQVISGPLDAPGKECHSVLVSDARKRELERLAGEGDLAARLRFLRGLVREGALLSWRIELAAYAGDEAAFEALEPVLQEELRAHEWRVHDASAVEATD
ncbi:MAG: hypothetical protein ACAI25_08040, partial [Planctomycetota bacterium]